MRQGNLKIIFGCMFSEKSGELIKECLLAEKYRGKKVIVFKPEIDDRFSKSETVSRIGLKIEAKSLPVNLASIKESLYSNASIEGIDISTVDIIAFDEVQFFNADIIEVIKYILCLGIDVVAAGLSTSYAGKPLGMMPHLILMADAIIHKKAYCTICGEPAIFSQRLVDGVEEISGEDIQIGDSEYQPRCRTHFVDGQTNNWPYYKILFKKQ